MRVRGLDGKEHIMHVAGKAVVGNATRPRSSGHLDARLLLKKLFPFDNPLEEVVIPGCDSTLYLDFLLSKKMLAVEVQGEQHRKFSPHFHGTPRGFLNQKKRDGQKREFCEINGFTLVELHDNERDKWEQQLRCAFGEEQAGGSEPESDRV